VYSKILILRFPITAAGRPVICKLASAYDLEFNLLNATILPRKEGRMVMELSGTKKNFKDGVNYLKSRGVDVQNASQDVSRDETSCTQCGACTAVCPTSALYIERPSMEVKFDQKKCSVCELCVATCPVRAMTVSPSNRIFFE
jgi:L-aspartate semialdehyde sulfurtransferase ferredoxin